MGTMTDKVNYLKTTKVQIRKAIEDKGVTVSDTDTFRDYATRIGEIPVDSRNIEDYLNSPLVSGRSYVGNFKEIPNINTSYMTSMTSMFSGCTSLTSISKLNTDKVTAMNYMFYACYSLTTIPQLNAGNVTNTDQMFYSCSALTTLGGLLNLGQAYSTSQSANYYYYELVLSTCTALTYDSLMNVINNLYDIKTKGCNAQSLTLGSTNIAKLTSEEIAIATNKGWTVS